MQAEITNVPAFVERFPRVSVIPFESDYKVCYFTFLIYERVFYLYIFRCAACSSPNGSSLLFTCSFKVS